MRGYGLSITGTQLGVHIDLGNSLMAYEEAIRLDPNDARAYFNKASILYVLGRPKEAKVARQKARQLEALE